VAGLDPAKQSGAECAHPHRDCFPRLSLGVAMTAGIGFTSQSNNALVDPRCRAGSLWRTLQHCILVTDDLECQLQCLVAVIRLGSRQRAI
jgi:hypothetical protein